MSDKIPMTREGYDKLVKELAYMKSAKRREIADDLARAVQLAYFMAPAYIANSATLFRRRTLFG